MPPFVSVPVRRRAVSIEDRPERPQTNEAKAARIVELALHTLVLCGWEADKVTYQEAEDAMREFEVRTYEMDTSLESAQSKTERNLLLDSHRKWVMCRIEDFPLDLVTESLFYFAQEAKFKLLPDHTISLGDIARISVARSNDIRALFALIKNDNDFEISPEAREYVDRLLVIFDLHEDLLDYEDDSEACTYNTWCALQRLNGDNSQQAATDFLNSELDKLFAAERQARSSGALSNEAIDRLQNVLLEGFPVRQVGARGLELFASDAFQLRRAVV